MTLMHRGFNTSTINRIQVQTLIILSLMGYFVVKIMACTKSLNQQKKVKPTQRSTHVLGIIDYCRRIAAERRRGVPVTYFTTYHNI